MLKYIKIPEIEKTVYSSETIDKAKELLSLLKGKTVDDCLTILGLTKSLLFSNSNLSIQDKSTNATESPR